MEKVTTINLAGNAYQIEEAGFDKLSSYLADAKAKLAGNPDASEIIADFEAALASKCRVHLNPHKSVITTAEVEKILSEMGPVEDAPEGGEGAKSAEAKPDTHKKLYRIREGSKVCGVCTGLSAYLDIDVTAIRILFLALITITSGAWILVYFLMAAFIPMADTPAERERAYGVPPVTAKTIFDRAHEGYENFTDSKEWKHWREQMKQQSAKWKEEWKSEKYHAHYHPRVPEGYYYSPFWSFMHSVLGLIWTVAIVYGLYLAYGHVPFARELMDTAGLAMQKAANNVAAWVQGW